MERASRQRGLAEEKKKGGERQTGRENKNCSITGQTHFFSFFEQVILQCKSMLAGQAACY